MRVRFVLGDGLFRLAIVACLIGLYVLLSGCSGPAFEINSQAREGTCTTVCSSVESTPETTTPQVEPDDSWWPF